jgi:hypothetical protein
LECVKLANKKNPLVQQEIELDTILKPFVPDYIPAVGELDSFLKVVFALISVELDLILD